jgi:hypothetical protein
LQLEVLQDVIVGAHVKELQASKPILRDGNLFALAAQRHLAIPSEILANPHISSPYVPNSSV